MKYKGKTLTERTAEHIAWLETDEGRASMEASWKIIESRLDRNKQWTDKIVEYVKSLSVKELDEVFTRFLKWEEDYEEMWYKKYVQTNSNIFDRILDAVKILGEDFEEQEDFFAYGYIYKNYIFKVYHGQGTIVRILDIAKPIKDELIFQTT